MPRLRLVLLVVLCGVLAVSALFVVRLAMPELFRKAPPVFTAESAMPSGKVRLAVLGDSNSQSYHDTLMLESDPPARGGIYRATTYQWTEILSRLRGDQLDPGEWGAWGTNWYRAFFDEARGALARTGPKDDYRYNFAISGATCNQLLGHKERQAIRLVDLMDTDPEGWRGGVVLISVGINDIGTHDVLDEFSRDPESPHATGLVKTCIEEISETVALIRKQHPDTYIALVGMLSNANWQGEFGNWQSAKEIANIDAGMELYDSGLRKLAATDRHLLFLDDRAWFRGLWGERDEQGRPIYKTVHLAPGWDVTNTSGDDPHNAVVADTHPGVVWNILWAQNLVAALNAAFGLHIRPITNDEAIHFLQPSFAAVHP